MKRIMSTVAALALVIGACGGGDDPSADASEESSTETTEESSGATAEETAIEESGPEETADEMTESTAGTTEPTSETTEPTSETTEPTTGTTDDGIGDDGGGTPIRSISDVPEVCREEMAEFLRAIEPIVSTIDWENATLADFETIAADFEAIADEFEVASAAASCDDLEFVGENETELMIEFAQDEAPGVVGFLEFISALSSPDAGGGGDAGSDGTIENCDDAIEFIQHLADTYDSMSSVPQSELIKMTQMSTALATCTPAQLALFDSGDLADFLAG